MASFIKTETSLGVLKDIQENKSLSCPSYATTDGEQQCPLCHLFVDKLNEHILLIHSQNEDLKLALCDLLSKQQIFNLLNKEDLWNNLQRDCQINMKSNIQKNDADKSNHSFIENNASSNNIFSIDSFSSLLGDSNTNLSVLKKECTIELCPPSTSTDPKHTHPNSYANYTPSEDTSTSISITPKNNDFQTCVMQLFSSDHIGTICKTNESLILLGECLYHRFIFQGKINSSAETVSHMRVLASLFDQFEKCASPYYSPDDIHFMSMFDKDNFSLVKKTIDVLSLGEHNYNIKKRYCSVLKTTVEMLRQNQFLNFKEKLSSHWDEFFRDIFIHNPKKNKVNLNTANVYGGSDYVAHSYSNKSVSKEFVTENRKHTSFSPMISLKKLSSLQESLKGHSSLIGSETHNALSLYPHFPISTVSRGQSEFAHNSFHHPNSVVGHNMMLHRKKLTLGLMNCSKSGRRRYLRWKAEDTNLVIEAFSRYICQEDEGCKGQLPGMSELRNFCCQHSLESLSGLDLMEACKALKVKVFNERKKLRERLAIDRSKSVGDDANGGFSIADGVEFGSMLTESRSEDNVFDFMIESTSSQ